MVHVHHDLPAHPTWNVIVFDLPVLKRTVLLIDRRKEGRDIDPGKFGRLMQKVLPAVDPLLFHALIETDDVNIVDLPLSQEEHVKKRGDGLRIIGAWTASDDDGIFLAAVFSQEGNLTQIQDLQDVGVTHLILDGDAQEVLIPDCCLGF